MKERARARTMTWTENTHTSVHLLSHSKCVCLIMALRRTLHSCNHHQLPGNKEKPLPTETQHTRLHYYCYRVAEARVCACIVCVRVCVSVVYGKKTTPWWNPKSFLTCYIIMFVELFITLTTVHGTFLNKTEKNVHTNITFKLCRLWSYADANIATYVINRLYNLGMFHVSCHTQVSHFIWYLPIYWDDIPHFCRGQIVFKSGFYLVEVNYWLIRLLLPVLWPVRKFARNKKSQTTQILYSWDYTV